MQRLPAFWAVLTVCFSSAAVWASVALSGAPQRRPAPSPLLIRAEVPRLESTDAAAYFPDPAWDDAIAGVVKLDESRSLRVVPPRAGLVTRVYVELGCEVNEGTPLFSLVSPGHAGELLVRAPRAGRVLEKHVQPGQHLRLPSERTLLTIADLRSVWVLANVFQLDAQTLTHGSPVSLALPALPGTILKGEVDDVSTQVDLEHRTVPVRIRLDNSAGRLKINMQARVRFPSLPSSILR